MLEALAVPTLAVLVGFALLVWGAGRFVVGAASTAYNLGVSQLVIGLTIVGLGTSAPEMIVAAMSAFEGKPGLAIGNAIGSNIANIALILGFTALVMPIVVRPGIVTRELPLLLIVTFATLVLFWDKNLSRLDGVLLLFGLAVVMTWIVRQAKQKRMDDIERELGIEVPAYTSTPRGIGLLLLGLAVLLGSSRMVVWGGVELAEFFGVSDLVIGLTIIAIGTSLPELAASIAASLRDHDEIVLGNIIGSNIYNLLGVLPIAALIAPGPVEADALSRDIPVMLVLTLALFAAAYGFSTNGGRINRLEGAILLTGFVSYMSYIYVTAR